MEIRGLGLISVRDLFGISAIRSAKDVEFVVILERWKEGQEYDRLGLDEEFYDVLGVELPLIRMPVGPGRNISILVEVAARNHLLKTKGYNAARTLVERLDKSLGESRG
jgi:HPr kinase/phosphorylase